MKQKIGIIASVLLLTFGFASNAMSQWVLLAQPFTEQPHPPGGGANAFAVMDSTIFIGGYQSIFRSTNEGMTWDSAGLANQHIHALLVDGKSLYAGGGHILEALFRSGDNGQSWVALDSGTIDVVQAIAKLDTTLFVGGSWTSKSGTHEGILRSADKGLTWTITNAGYPNVYATSFANIGPTFFVGINGGIFRSSDGGMDWILPDTTGIPNIHCLATEGINLFAGSDEGILISTNNGSKWDTSYRGDLVLSIITSGRDIFAGTINHGVIHSSDTGKTWKQINGGMGSNRINALIVSTKYLFAGDEAGKIWRRLLSDISSVIPNAVTQENITLSPNPTTGIIAVQNTPANILHVTVSSILGESVLELAHPNAPEFTLDLSKLPAGIYFARFETAGEVVTRKIIKE